MCNSYNEKAQLMQLRENDKLIRTASEKFRESECVKMSEQRVD